MKKSIKVRMLFTFSMIVLLSCIVISIASYKSAENLVKESLSSVATNSASRALDIIDVQKYEEITLESGETSYYHELRSQLNELRETTGLVYLYTMSREQSNGGYSYYYMVDGMPDGDENASLLGEKEENVKYYPMMDKVFETGKPEIEMASSDDYGALITSYIPIKSADGEVIGIIGADFDASQAYQVMNANKLKLIVLTLLILLVSLVLIIVFTHYLMKPLKQLTIEVEKVKDGDLSSIIEPNSSDEFGMLTGSFQGMVQDVRQIIEGINHNSVQLVDTSGQLLKNVSEIKKGSQQVIDSMHEIATGTNIQFKSAEDGVLVMEEMSKGIQHSAAASSIVSERAVSTLIEAEKGYEKVINAVSQMNNINESVEQSGHAIKKLERQSAEVSAIMHVIETISSQTNLLALNAAIEAARAGEHGRGFAIVAEEVRKLADQSAHSANNVSQLISKMNEDTARSVETMDIVVESVKSGIVIVQEAGKTFETILASMKDIAYQIKEVSSVSEELTASSEEFVASAEESVQIAKQSANNTEKVKNITLEQDHFFNHMSLSIEYLAKMSEELNELVRKFKL